MEHGDEGFAAAEGSRPPCIELPEPNVIRVGLAVNRRVTSRLPPQRVPGQSSRHRKRRRRGGRRPCKISKEKENTETLTSKSGQRTYDHAITEFVEWYCSEPRLAFNRTVVLRYRINLEQKQFAPSTINLRLAAVRRIAYEGADSGLLSPELAAGIRRVKGVRRLGVRVGNWLTAEQGKRLLEASSAETLRGKRNSAMLATLIGFGLRRAEFAWPNYAIHSVTRGALGDCRFGWQGWAHSHGSDSALGKEAIDAWTEAAQIKERCVFRSINKAGPIWGNGMTPKVLWEVVKDAARQAGIDKLAPHDLRRTCARLCHLAGGELDQIQFLLGHVSIQTTERYLGCKQKLRIAVNDKLVIEPSDAL
jgi:site-specific recombinase XerD